MSKAIPASVTSLIDAFSRLPGIGPKTASRLTYFLLRAPNELSETLSQAITELKAKTQLCSICYNITEQNPCAICQDTQRDSGTLCVVEEPLDVLAVERTNSFNGRYHVLHGVISPREGIGPEQLKIKELVKRVQAGGIDELIISTNPGMEGDVTANMIKEELKGHPVKLTRLARGLPIGADLEYADAMTVSKALQGRQTL